jgi:hypothetical protein
MAATTSRASWTASASPLVEVVTVGCHGVGDVRDTDHVALADHGVGVERGGFHLDRHDPERFVSR